MSNLCYAGIGSRETPYLVMRLMTEMASSMEKTGWLLRTGGARGADMAFMDGVKNKDHKDVFYASDATEKAIHHASLYHRNWNACSDYAKKLHGRNSMIILGPHLNSPVDIVFCWTPNGSGSGGTGQAKRVAVALHIDILDIGLYSSEAMMLQQMKESVDFIEKEEKKNG